MELLLPENRPQRKPAAQTPDAQNLQDQLAIGSTSSFHLKFEFFYQQVQYASHEATVANGDHVQRVSRELYQRISARFSLDLSFVTRLAQQTGRAAALDPQTLQRFSDAAMGLANMDRGSLDTFLNEVDHLFNAVEDTLGLDNDQLDGFAQTVKDAANHFFEEIRSATESFAAQKTASAQDFRQQLKSMLGPNRQTLGDLEKLRQNLAMAGVSESRQADLLKLANLILKFANRQDGEGATGLLNPLLELAKRRDQAEEDRQNPITNPLQQKQLQAYKFVA
ncbi:MAG: hypothetical protein D6814_17020 [Calditrichaeota bacterium]|nr:MAG: hypothetical protein D6814_17020 [Calditrichota bacterium]